MSLVGLLILVIGLILVIAIGYAILTRAVPQLPPAFQPWAWIFVLVILLIVVIELFFGGGLATMGLSIR